MKKIRSCDNPLPLYGGKNCSRFGPSIETKTCNPNKCPGMELSLTTVQQHFTNALLHVSERALSLRHPLSPPQDFFGRSLDSLATQR